MERMFVVCGAVMGFVGVGAGAFGAHLLKTLLPADLLEIFEIAVRYQMYHALALVAVGLLAGRAAGGATSVAGWAFLIGIVIFSGSLYLLALTGQRWLGAVTPIGGVAFLVGWAALAWSVLSR